MERWRRAWRNGFSRQLSTSGLLALREALANDDPRLIQGPHTLPRHHCVRDSECWPICPVKVEAACIICFAGWMGEWMSFVGDVRDYYENVFETSDWDADAYAFISWYDRAPRARMLKVMLAEVELALAERASRARSGMLTQWMNVAERMYGDCGGPAGKAKGRAAKRKAAQRELVSC